MEWRCSLQLINYKPQITICVHTKFYGVNKNNIWFNRRSEKATVFVCARKHFVAQPKNVTLEICNKNWLTFISQCQLSRWCAGAHINTILYLPPLGTVQRCVFFFLLLVCFVRSPAVWMICLIRCEYSINIEFRFQILFVDRIKEPLDVNSSKLYQLKHHK